MLKILFYKNQGIHWYPCHPTFLWKFNFTLVQRLISALIWDISGLWNPSDGRDFREKRIDMSRFLTPYMLEEISKGPLAVSLKPPLIIKDRFLCIITVGLPNRFGFFSKMPKVKKTQSLKNSWFSGFERFERVLSHI